MTPENDGKLYWIGKMARAGKHQGVYNKYLGTLIPIFNLGNNYEIIDM